ncbi:MAG: pyridoxamine 5'-phosphate oxidase family protein [Acidimicrobiales bacterium]|nr:pyridoxamine 5'-phosphate oxidase family protein [Acidimicrobiales bacterium]
MTEKLVEHSSWDNRPRDEMSHEAMLEVIDGATTCVFIRLRGDGHPIGAVVGGGVIDGEIYTLTNLFRAAYRNVQHDDRCSAVFDQPQVASVTVIGRAEIVDDPAVLERFFRSRAPKSWLVTSGKLTEEEFLELAWTPNRRLFHIIPEKFFSSDQRTLLNK